MPWTRRQDMRDAQLGSPVTTMPPSPNDCTIDPFFAFLSASACSISDQLVRQALTPMAQVAATTRITAAPYPTKSSFQTDGSSSGCAGRVRGKDARSPDSGCYRGD